MEWDLPNVKHCIEWLITSPNLYHKAFEHLAYFVSASTSPLHVMGSSNNLYDSFLDTFEAFAADHIGEKGSNSAFIVRCYREFHHAQWAIILDDDFLEAYVHDVVIDCCDRQRPKFNVQSVA
jgi:hypothetical protein